MMKIALAPKNVVARAESFMARKMGIYGGPEP